MGQVAAATMGEEAFAAWVESQLSEAGWQVFAEVPLMNRRIDLVAVDPDGRMLAIEVKLTNWRRAIAQAREHRIACDGVAVCLPRPAPTSSMKEVLTSEGIAFIGMEAESELLRMPPHPWHGQRKWSVAVGWLERSLGARGWAR